MTKSWYAEQHIEFIRKTTDAMQQC